MADTVEFEILKELVQLKPRGKDEKQLNIISWNYNFPPVFDLRYWRKDGTMPYRGITFSREEAKVLIKVLQQFIESEEAEEIFGMDIDKVVAQLKAHKAEQEAQAEQQAKQE